MAITLELTEAKGKNPRDPFGGLGRFYRTRARARARVVFNFYQMEIRTKRENCYLEDTSRGRVRILLLGTDYAAPGLACGRS